MYFFDIYLFHIALLSIVINLQCRLMLLKSHEVTHQCKNNFVNKEISYQIFNSLLYVLNRKAQFTKQQFQCTFELQKKTLWCSSKKKFDYYSKLQGEKNDIVLANRKNGILNIHPHLKIKMGPTFLSNLNGWVLVVLHKDEFGLQAWYRYINEVHM